MAETYDSSWAIQLPNFAPPVGNVIQSGIDRQERQIEKQWAMQQQKQAQKDADKKWQLTQTQDATDPTRNQTPEFAFNQLYNNKVAEVQKKANDMIAKGTDNASLMEYLSTNMTPIINLYNYGNAKLKQIGEEAAVAAKERGDLDIGKLKKNAVNNWLASIKDPVTGQPKPIDQLALDNRSYIREELDDPNKAWRYSSGDIFRDAIQKAEGAEEVTFTRKTPDGNLIPVTGKLPLWSEPNVKADPLTGLTPAGIEPKFNLKGSKDYYTNAKGETVQGFAMDEKALENVLKSPKNRESFNFLYNTYLDNLLPEQRPKTKDDDDVLRKIFAATEFIHNDRNQPKSKSAPIQGKKTLSDELREYEGKAKIDAKYKKKETYDWAVQTLDENTPKEGMKASDMYPSNYTWTAPKISHPLIINSIENEGDKPKNLYYDYNKGVYVAEFTNKDGVLNKIDKEGKVIEEVPKNGALSKSEKEQGYKLIPKIDESRTMEIPKKTLVELMAANTSNQKSISIERGVFENKGDNKIFNPQGKSAY